MFKLRDYQNRLLVSILEAWKFFKVVMAVAPTRSGKTVVFSKLLHDHKGASCAIVHRQELVSQIALALARNGVRHRIIGQESTRKLCQRVQLRRLGRHFVDQNAACAVAGVDSLVNLDPNDALFRQVSLIVGDEGHHFLQDNKWGTAHAMFGHPDLRTLLVTATCTRADGRGLGATSDGLADTIILAPSLRDLINEGYILDSRVFTVPSDVDYSNVPVGASGELVYAKLRQAVHESGTFVGDVVKSYLRIAPGKQAIVFAVDVESAGEIAEALRKAGVPAETVHAKTPDDLRFSLMQDFESGKLKILVNVDLFGEGYDLPNLEVVIMARRTESFPLFAQQSARASNVKVTSELEKRWDLFTCEQRKELIAQSDKPCSIIIDHVGNVLRHAVMRHDATSGRLVLDLCHREWSLDRREGKRGGTPAGTVPYRICLNIPVNGPGIVCDTHYPRYLKCCPECGFYPEVAGRSTPDQVDGDLGELDEAALIELHGRMNKPLSIPYNAPWPIESRLTTIYEEKQRAHAALRNALKWYGGLLSAKGITDTREQWKYFYLEVGIDAGTIQTLPASEVWEWFGKINTILARDHIDGTVSTE